MQVRFCPQCGKKIRREEFNCSTFCSRCGCEYRRLHVINPTQPKPVINASGIMTKVIRGIQFSVEHPNAFAATATTAGAAGLLIGPMVAAAGKMGMIAGGVLVGAGALLKSHEGTELCKAGGLILGGSAALTGIGYVMIAAGGVSAVAGIGVGTVQVAKGTCRAIEHIRNQQTIPPCGEVNLITKQG